MGYSLGVDLGTTYSAAAVARGDSVEVATLGTTAPQVPSVVVLRADGEILTGEAAERRSANEPTRTAREFKRRLGDPVPIIIGGTPYGAESLMAHLLRAVVAQITEREGEPPETVVLTHPANYTEYKRGLLEEAARLAGLDLSRVQLVTEPEAAAIAYTRQQRIEPGEAVAVYDFGGGTFDAAVVRRTDSGFEIIGTPEGMERLGGIDFDQAVLAHVDDAVDGLVTDADPEDPNVRAGQSRLRDQCRQAKEALSVDTDTSIPVQLPGLQTDVRLTRDELETMVRPRVAETVAALDRAVASAGLTMAEISRVLLVGGSSRMPVVAQEVRTATGRPVALDAHPKFAIATGAALAGATPPEADAPTAVVEPVAEAPTPPVAKAGRLRRGDVAKGTVVGGLGAGAGVAAAGSVGSSAAGAATSTLVGAGVGPTGAVLGAAGPAGTAAAAGPVGTAAATGPAGHALTGAKVAKVAAARPRLGLIAGAVLGSAAVAGSAIVMTSGGDEPVAATTTVAVSQESSTTTTVVAAPEVTTGRGVEGVVTFVAGNGTTALGAEAGEAGGVSLGDPDSMAVTDDGVVYLNGTGGLARVEDGQVTIAEDLPDGEPSVGGVAVAPDGSVWFTTSAGLRHLPAAGGPSELVTPPDDANIGSAPGAVAVDGAGNVYFYDVGSYRVLRWGSGGGLSVVAGSGTLAAIGGSVAEGGAATSQALGEVTAMAVTPAGELLIVDKRIGRVLSVDGSGAITTLAGGGATPVQPNTQVFAPDGTAATDLELLAVSGIEVDGDGRVYVADAGAHLVFRIDDGAITLVAADQRDTTEEDGQPANATRFSATDQIGFDGTGDLYVLGGSKVRRIADVASS